MLISLAFWAAIIAVVLSFITVLSALGLRSMVKETDPESGVVLLVISLMMGGSIGATGLGALVAGLIAVVAYLIDAIDHSGIVL